MKDIISDIKVAGYDQITSNGNTTAVDRKGFEGVSFLGTNITAATAGLRLTECDTVGGTYTDVAADQMFGSVGIIDIDGIVKVGYTGYKQFVRLETNAAAGSVVDVVTVLGAPAHQAQA